MTCTFRRLVLGVMCAVAFAQTACPAAHEALAPDALPPEVRADYEVFADRCSKCHALSRPLNSGIVSDDHWAMYVGRMRRQPGSGISLDDAEVILRFLHYYSLEQIRKQRAHESSALAPEPPAAASSSGDVQRLPAVPSTVEASDAG
jgi:hypothetical protein